MKRNMKKIVSKVLAFALIGGLAFSPMVASAKKQNTTYSSSSSSSSYGGAGICNADITRKAKDFNSATGSEYSISMAKNKYSGEGRAASVLNIGKNYEAKMETTFTFGKKNMKIKGVLHNPGVTFDSYAVYVANLNAKKLTYKKVANGKSGDISFAYTAKKPFKNKAKGITIDSQLKGYGESSSTSTGSANSGKVGVTAINTNNAESTSTGKYVAPKYYLGGYIVKVVYKKNGKVYTTKSVSPVLLAKSGKDSITFSGDTSSHSGTGCYVVSYFSYGNTATSTSTSKGASTGTGKKKTS